MLEPAAARWPSVRPGRGHYERYFLRAVHPSQPRGVWIRFTVTVPVGGAPVGRLWFALFDRTASAPRAVRVDAGAPVALDGGGITLGGGRFADPEISGTAHSAAATVRWDLRCRGGEPPLLHLPRPWMYTARLPRTKLLSLRPATVFDGTVEVDGEQIPVEGWPGMVGHNWGEEHAARWIWLHAVGLDGAGPETWLDLAIARVRLGPALTPWTANGALSLGGRRLALGGLGRRVRVAETAAGAQVRLAGRDVTVSASVSAPRSAFVEWDYANPSGAVHRVINCSVADVTLRVTRRSHPPVALTGAACGVYELGRESRPSTNSQ
jgi:hypothetical protein